MLKEDVGRTWELKASAKSVMLTPSSPAPAKSSAMPLCSPPSLATSLSSSSWPVPSKGIACGGGLAQGKRRAMGKTQAKGKAFTAAPKAVDQTKRKVAPPVYNRARGSKQVALETARDPEAMDAAMSNYMKDWVSQGDTSDTYVKSWMDFHEAHWDEALRPLDVLPLTPQKMHVVGALLTHADYRSAKNYLSAVKKLRYESNTEWPTGLELAERRFRAAQHALKVELEAEVGGASCALGPPPSSPHPPQLLWQG